MPRFRSWDGTAIAYERKSTGGPPVILVHGSASDGKRWQPILPMIDEHFSIYTFDRRGYGNSENGTTYSIEAEFDDILALAETIKAGPVDIVGHSYGALCALGAATRRGPFRRLVLYEPPLPLKPNAYFKRGLPSTMREALSRGDAETAMIAFLTHVMAVGSAEIAGMRRLGSWTPFVQHAARVLCELEAVEGLRGQVQMFRSCRTPTLLLLGGESPPAYQNTAEGLLQTLQSSRIAVLKGQAHAAINAAPKLVADQIVRFLTAPATAAIRRTRVPRSRAS